jgi:hypothetical protein
VAPHAHLYRIAIIALATSAGFFVLSSKAIVPAQWTLVSRFDKNTAGKSLDQGVDEFQLSLLFLLASVKVLLMHTGPQACVCLLFISSALATSPVLFADAS